MTRRLRLLFAASSLAGLCAAARPACAGPSAAGDPEPAGLPPEDQALVRAHLARIESVLRDNILSFWLKHARDRERGGFFGEISNDLEVKKDAPRGALLTARVLWTFSAAYRRSRDPACLDMARWAFEDLVARFWDEEHGGLYWSVTAGGRPLETRKQIYVQAFGIYGLSEYYRASGDAAALKRAIALYRTVEARCRDHEHGGYFEEFARDWTPARDWRGGLMNTGGPKSQNAHLHLMEAYANLLRAWPDRGLRNDLGQLVEVMTTRILNPATHHLGLFFDGDWTPRSDGISFGHDIEASWLLPETAAALGDAALAARMKPAALEIARVTLAEGLDADGGLFYEADPHGLTNTDKEWWPQAEAAIGFLNAFQLSGDRRFLLASLRVWDFIESRLVDRKNGEWFRVVTREGVVRRGPPKVNFWKCPYHDGRACMELIDRLRALLPQPYNSPRQDVN